MSEQINICEICGGIKAVAHFVEDVPTSLTVTASSVPKSTALTITADSVPASKGWGHLCYGHPKFAPKHDGKLGDDYEVCMGITQVYPSGRREFKQGITILGYDDMMCLEPKQAISLLSWLELNRAELTALAEQERE